MPTEEKKERRAKINTYAETACGCFTTLQKRAAFAVASSRLVAAAEPLGFFGRPPKRVGAAPCSQNSRRACSLVVGCRLAARNRFGLVIIRPVVETGGQPGAAYLAASPYGVVV